MRPRFCIRLGARTCLYVSNEHLCVDNQTQITTDGVRLLLCRSSVNRWRGLRRRTCMYMALACFPTWAHATKHWCSPFGVLEGKSIQMFVNIDLLSILTIVGEGLHCLTSRSLAAHSLANADGGSQGHILNYPMTWYISYLFLNNIADRLRTG